MSAPEVVLRRFWAKVDKSGECWIWTAYRNSTDYGIFALTTSQNVYAHRFAYVTEVGPIPDGLVLDHLCRVPACVNPAHLEPVTHGENTRRGLALDRVRNQDTCRNGRHPWPESRVKRGGKFRCHACEQEGSQRRYARRKAAA